MNTPADSSRKVRDLLDGIKQDERPTEVERRRIEQHMWRAIDESHAVDAGKNQQDAADVTLLNPTATIAASRRLVSRALVAAVAVLFATIGYRWFGDFHERSGTIEFTQESSNREVFLTIGGASVSFSLPSSAHVSTSTEEFAVLREGEGQRDEAADLSDTGGAVVLARPSVIFDGLDPEEWFKETGIQATRVLARNQDELIEAWSLVIPRSVAEARGCEPGEPCIVFAELGSGQSLSLEAGFKLNTVRLIRLETGPPLVLFALQQGPLQGPSDDPVAQLRDEVLATLEVGAD